VEPEGSLPHSQVPATYPYPESARSSPYPHIALPEESYYIRLGLPSGLFTSGFPTNTLYTPLLSPTRATCLAHLILLDFIIRTVLGEEYRSLSSSLCSFLQSMCTYNLNVVAMIMNKLARAAPLHMYYQARYACLKNYNHDFCSLRIFFG